MMIDLSIKKRTTGVWGLPRSSFTAHSSGNVEMMPRFLGRVKQEQVPTVGRSRWGVCLEQVQHE